MILYAQNTERLVKGKAKTYLSSPAAAGDSTLTVESGASFSIGQQIEIGNVGEERSEVIRIHTVTAVTATVITLNTTLVYAHPTGTPVYLFDFDQVEFSRSTTTDSSLGAVLTTSAITPDQMQTIYEDLTNTTGFGFYRFKNSATSAFTSYSDPIPYAGYAVNAVATVIDRALSVTSQEINPRLTYDTCFHFVNDFTVYANALNHNWSEAKVCDYEMKTLATGDFQVNLPTDISRTNDPSAIIGIQVTGFPPIRNVSQREWNQATLDLRSTTLATSITGASITVVLTNSSSFADSGSIQIDGDVIAYTANNRTTNTLSGVTGIDANHAAGVVALQRFIMDVPTIYTIMNSSTIQLWPLAGAIVNNRILKLDYYKKIPTIDSLNDTVTMTNIQPAIDYVAYRIRKWNAGGTLSLTDEDYQQFTKSMVELINRDSTGEPGRIRLK